MGEAGTLRCEACGFSKRLSIGPGFNSGWHNESTRRDVLAGKYGRKPKTILEENPDSACSWYMALFHCKCGNYSSKDAVVIYDHERHLYRPSMRCDLCHRKMFEVNSIVCARCPKCGEGMHWELEILWD